MDKRRLAALLDSLPSFPRPKQILEQYTTPGDVAATIAWTMYMKKELNEGWTADFGCGTGRLAYAASALGGRSVCIDVDLDALAVSKSIGLDAVNCDATRPCVKRGVKAIMNPPFGVWKRHADAEFVEGAAAVADIIYSMHKYTAVEYILGLAKSLGYKAELLDVVRIDIPPIFPHHRKRRHRVAVAIVRLESTSPRRRDP